MSTKRFGFSLGATSAPPLARIGFGAKIMFGINAICASASLSSTSSHASRASPLLCPHRQGATMGIDEQKFVQDLAELVKLGVEAERERCIAICEGWIGRFQDTEIQYTSPREYAVDAIEDIVDLIRDGTDPRPAVGRERDPS